MGKFKITVNPEQEHKNPHTGSSMDSFIQEQNLDVSVPVREVIVEKHIVEVQKCEGCKCEPSKPDYRLRKYTAAIRKELNDKANVASIDQLHIRLDVQKENIKSLAQSVDALHADIQGQEKHDVKQLEKQISKLDHHLELIEQELKVKPVSIKTERVIERFDHRLTLATILMLVINAFLVMHILSN